jgi:excisionase family DNA binding protein
VALNNQKYIDMIEKVFLTTKEAAAYLGMALSYLYKLTAKKSIPFYTPTGKKIYFKKSELDEWMNRGRVATNEENESRAQSSLTGK